ncbi:MAG: SDR family NAD(P)-dependent oxidoreductase, partial [Oscillospiraceae bacterium]|nr:SDR family NAD(P)-dependent oxidoreductase [Oscillospiraceae bacterium]
MSKNVLVTGSSNGIGAATAIAFAQKGWNVGITYCKNPEGAQKIQQECLRYGVDARIYRADFQYREDCERLMKEYLVDFKTIDVLINNAGGAL